MIPISTEHADTRGAVVVVVPNVLVVGNRVAEVAAVICEDESVPNDGNCVEAVVTVGTMVK